MKVLEVIPSKVWKNKNTGATASIYGAVPYHTTAEAEGWEIITRGFTWVNSNGTVGLGRVPAKTYEEAVEVMNKFNARGSKWKCLTCTREGFGETPKACPSCLSEHDANHGPHATK